MAATAAGLLAGPPMGMLPPYQVRQDPLPVSFGVALPTYPSACR